MSFHKINPATGLPMSDGGYGGFDIGGSPWGIDNYSNHNPWSSGEWNSDFF